MLHLTMEDRAAPGPNPEEIHLMVFHHDRHQHIHSNHHQAVEIDNMTDLFSQDTASEDAELEKLAV